MTKYEPLVPLSELGLESMTGAELKAYAGLSGLTIERDYLDRPAISLEAAYAIGEQRRRTEKEWADSESRRRAEHAKAVKALQQRCNAEFAAVRTAHMAATVGAHLFGGQVERDGIALNEGLVAARMIWAAAPAAVRDEVQSVDYEDAGGTNVVPINISMPLNLITDYAHAAARQRRH